MMVLPIDLETSLHNQGAGAVGGFDADPFHPDNWIVWAGWTVLNDQLKQITEDQVRRYTEPNAAAIPAPDMSKGDVVVTGHNIAFDLMYLVLHNQYGHAWREAIMHPGFHIWDTQTVEFRLLGQTKPQPSMDSAAESRGWPLKPHRMKEYWKNGISTEDIPDEEVEPYMYHDVSTTTRLFKDQVAQVTKRGMMKVVRSEMGAQLTTLIMRLNGMYFDKTKAMDLYENVYEPKLKGLQEQVTAKLAALTGIPGEHINPNSNPLLTKVLYGGTVKYTIKVQKTKLNEETGELDAVRYKSGKRKGELALANEEVEVEVKAHAFGKHEGAGEDTLKEIKATKSYLPELEDVFDMILDLRATSKLATTYYLGYSKLTWSNDNEVNLIHGNLNHSVAVTTRLSSSAPNLQNAAHNEIRECFTSRFVDGVLMEVDLSQIEIVVQAVLTGDEQLIADILEGVDFHSKRAAKAHNEEYDVVLAAVQAEDPGWTKKRKGAKVFSFQRAYGAGVPLIAATTGMARSEVQALVDAEETMYSGVVKQNDEWLEAVKKSVKLRDGMVCGTMQSPTGTEYRFQRQSDRRGGESIKPTNVKNYPIQGFAADIIKVILANLRQFMNEYNAIEQPQGMPILMVNTVHDSVIFDLPPSADAKKFALAAVTLFERTVEDIDQLYGVKFPVPIRATAAIGPHWGDMKECRVRPEGCIDSA
jgi:DNA polymerase-1